MNKTAFKIFIVFTLTAAILATVLLCINFLGFGIIGSEDNNIFGVSPKHILSETKYMYESGGDLASVIPDGVWCILIDADGNTVWQYNKPGDIPSHYSINDIAKMTRWFINDYPVYVSAEDYGLFVLGYPKNAVGKYSIEYSMRWFQTLPARLAAVLIFNLLLATIFALIFGLRLFKRLRLLANGISDLRCERDVRIPETGLFKELSHNINEAANVINRKNAALAVRDNARRNWVSGISHDIRTPLTIIVGNAESIENTADDELRRRAETITAQCMKIKKLVEGLNLISSLEYDMQPQRKTTVLICPMIRRVASEVLNNILANDSRYEINLDLNCGNSAVDGDKALLERALFNLINNSIEHNKNGCKIYICSAQTDNSVYITVRDTGCGIPNEVIQNIDIIPETPDGLGLPMANKIVSVHGGQMHIDNKNGTAIKISLPRAHNK